MAPSAVRTAGRLSLILAGGLGFTVVFAQVGNPVGADQAVWLDTFWGSTLAVGLLVVLLVLTDICLGRVERTSDTPQRTVRSLAVLGTGLALSAGVTALLMLRWVLYDPLPTVPSAEEVRERAAVQLEELVAAGSGPVGVAEVIAGLPAEATNQCISRRGRVYGEHLSWNHETTNTIVEPAVALSPHGVPGWSEDAKASVTRMAATLQGEGFMVKQDIDFGTIGFTATHVGPRVGLSHVSFHAQLRPLEDNATVLAEFTVLANSTCMHRD